MKLKTKRMMTALAFTTLLPLVATAQIQDAKNQGYLIDARGDIVKNGTGLCWHTSDWTPARAVEGCDPVSKPVVMAPPAPRAVAVAPPLPVVVAAAPPAIIPIAVVPSTQKVSLSGEALFAFDKSVLKPEGSTMLDGLVSQLAGTTYATILVTGHTDRLGSNAYNQKLSERRAQTVKDYLINKNVQTGRIDAQGKSETQPVTKAGECLGAQSTRVIACLQPDRRVDVEITGTKSVASAR